MRAEASGGVEARCAEVTRAARATWARAGAGSARVALAGLVLALLSGGVGAQVPAYPPGPGDPGEWEQGVEYRIEARLDEAAQELQGRARVRYRNNSPDTVPDFYFHLYLNAFRPNSLWARTDLAAGITTFQALGPDEHGYERIRELTVQGQPVRLRYPFAPDSTIVGFDLPRPLAPGQSLEIDLRWDARTSTVARRQGRQGRQWDFAQWYPRVVVYDDEGWRTHPLYRSGEFYGEFATYDVTVDVAEDQVMGATGVPVSGDPGWEGAAALGTGPIVYDRDWYGTVEGPPCLERSGERVCGVYPARSLGREERLGLLEAEAAAPGRKRVRWHAEQVHHFAWSTSPDYIYEQGVWDDVSIHVLYRPGDEAEWGNGIAVRRTATALAWMDTLFGDYPYPQVTNLHRIEGGGTEFPMLIMDGSASQGLILHEVGHIYAHGILANNEWYEGWLDEGLSSFQTAWFSEATGATDDAFAGTVAGVLARDLAGVSEPVVLAGEDYSSGSAYSSAIYRKGSVVFWMLRELVGEETFTEILRTYYERYRFRHVDTDDFKAVAEEVSGVDLDWFFAGWLHTTGLVDYALSEVQVTPVSAGRWQTVFTVSKKGDLRMPVTVRLVDASGARRDVVAPGAAAEDRLLVETEFEPVAIVLDPDGTALDWNPSNNGWGAGLFADPVRRISFDRRPFSPLATDRSHVPVAVRPNVWGNQVGGFTLGVGLRRSVMGLRDTELMIGLPAIPALGVAEDRESVDLGSVALRHVRRGVADDAGKELEFFGFAGEGRALGRLARRVTSASLGGELTTRVGMTVAAIYEPDYLIPEAWTPREGMSGELQGGLDWSGGGEGALGLSADLGVGADSRETAWVRLSGALRATHEVADGIELEGDLFGGWVNGFVYTTGSTASGGNEAPAERRFSAGSVDPWRALATPRFRSRGASLDREGWMSGGGTLRGIDPRLSFPWIVTAAGTLRLPGLTVAEYGVRPFLSAGAGVGGDLEATLVDDEAGRVLWSAGPGLEFSAPDGGTRLRIDLPLVVSDPQLAGGARDDTFGLRVQVGFVKR